MIINEIHSFVKFLKNQGQNIYHTPEEIDDAINRASLDLFRQEIKVFEREQILTDTLRPFKAREVYSSAGSLYDLPEDYIMATNVSHMYSNTIERSEADASTFCDNSLNGDTATASTNEKEIDIITDSDWVKRMDNLIVGPTEKSPIARIFNNNFEVKPNTVIPILYYLKEPVKAKWAYTISEDGRSYIFDEGNSTDLEWTTISHSEIIEKSLGYLGVAVRDQVLMQYEQFQKGNNNEQ